MYRPEETQAVKRERHIIPAVDDVIHQLRGSSVFSKLDATSGFWQIPLDLTTAKLTTFITPFGRFFFKRVTFGISSAPEIFQRTMIKILAGIDGVILLRLWKFALHHKGPQVRYIGKSMCS